MDKPIERTVIWDEQGKCWRDKVTGVDVKGMGRPLWGERGGFGVSYWEEAHSQPRDAHEQHIFALFDRRFDERIKAVHSLIDVMRDDWLPAAVERELAERIAMHPMYYYDAAKIPTVGYIHDLLNDYQRLVDQVRQLREQVTSLARPWWERWFS